VLLGAYELTEMQSVLHFWKVSSIGNHFPLIHAEDYSGDFPALAIAMCKQHFGIGGDGILVVGREGEGIRLRMFNPDGTEDFCGNGIRCAAHHAVNMGWIGDQFNIFHRDQTVPITVKDGLIRSIIGSASYDPEKVPTSIHGELFDDQVFAGRDGDWSVVLRGSALTTGSTHVVLPTESLPDDEGFISISSKLEVDPRFPNRTSVIWAARDGDALKIRIWERGAGETLGCGTGSSAAAINWMRLRGRGGRIEVKNPGGTVWVEADAWDQPITLEGRAETLFEGDFSLLIS
jgi:diaminopimelate epimerase